MKRETDGLDSDKPPCDCPVSDALLRRWLSARKSGGVSVLRLLGEARSAVERRVLGILSLFAADESLERVVFGDPQHPDHGVLRCRERARAIERSPED